MGDETNSPSGDRENEPEPIRGRGDVVGGQAEVDKHEHEGVAIEAAQSLDPALRSLVQIGVGRCVLDHDPGSLGGRILFAEGDVNGVNIGSMHHQVNDVNIRRYNAPMARSTYHHGDLRRALLTEASELARSSGPEAVTLREVARRLGVSPAAIYCHVADREALLGEVAAMARLELAQRMLGEVEQVAETDPQMRSIRRFGAIGRGYLLFAAEEPNLLAAAFLPIQPPRGLPETPNPWDLLAASLDELVTTGAMPAERRAGAETIAWSAVHGFATLRASRAFDESGEPDPDPDALLDAIARSLDVKPRLPSG